VHYLENNVLDNTLSIGLTGGIGSGKSFVADLFALQGASIVDTDVVAHQLTAPGGRAMPAIRDAFGADFINADGSLNRAAMRARVFTDGDAKRRLEAILHPLIGADTDAAAQRADGDYVIFVVPLLVESGRWVDRVDRVLVVDCPEALQIARVMQRSQLPAAQVEAIMASQASREQRLAVADDVIVNDGERAAVEVAVARLHAQYLALARKKALAIPVKGL
jgi:dephospho-CoA kinase